MSSVIVTYLGFVVVIVIVFWSVFLLRQRMLKQRRSLRSPLSTLEQFKPIVVLPLASPPADEDEDEEHLNHHSRAQQNGHYSGSKPHP